MSVIDVCNVLTTVWDCVKEHIPEKKQEDVGASIIEALMKADVIEDVKELELAIGVDHALDESIKLILEEYADNTRDDDDDYNGYGDDE